MGLKKRIKWTYLLAGLLIFIPGIIVLAVYRDFGLLFGCLIFSPVITGISLMLIFAGLSSKFRKELEEDDE